MKSYQLLVLCALMMFSLRLNAQTIVNLNPVAEQIMLGNYNPATYAATTAITNHAQIAQGINSGVSPDSLHKYLEGLATFYNRNMMSDTVSNTRGIGAARRWIYSKFQEFSAASENRLILSYLQFDTIVSVSGGSVPCNTGIKTRHKNVMAVLPGSDTTDKSIIIIQGHMDSRCAGVCDTACLAQGEEDNGSGTAMVMELARVMSKFTFKNTIVFSTLTGEEQGLYGGTAFAAYCKNLNIKVKAVQNNDIEGGILCGYTASASGDPLYPACSGYGSVDSTHYRLFSLGGFNSQCKSFARFVKLEYKEELLPYVSVPTTINILTPEDRTGRGSDHKPFTARGITAIRLTSANEAGNGASTHVEDRQHTTGDILGVDLNSDGTLDSFYVDFNYLARNSCINGTAATMAAIGPNQPDFLATNAGMISGGYKIAIQITQQTQYPQYRVGIRTTKNDFDSVFTITGKTTDTISVPFSANVYYITTASVDSNGVESLFSIERSVTVTGIEENNAHPKGLYLLPNYPNPFDDATTIGVMVAQHQNYKEAYISINDITGKEVQRMNIDLKDGVNEIMYEHGNRISGTYSCSLVIDGKIVETKRMVFTR